MKTIEQVREKISALIEGLQYSYNSYRSLNPHLYDDIRFSLQERIRVMVKLQKWLESDDEIIGKTSDQIIEKFQPALDSLKDK